MAIIRTPRPKPRRHRWEIAAITIAAITSLMLVHLSTALLLMACVLLLVGVAHWARR
jgi:hypothetical protein